MFRKIFLIAEAGSNHNGDLDTAVELVRQAARAGADAVKFQCYSLDSLFAPEHYATALKLKNGGWKDEIEKYTFQPDWHQIIATEAEKAGIAYFTTPFSPDCVERIDPFVPFYKIASCDITFSYLLKKVGSKRKGVFLSTGASSVQEIDRAVKTLRSFSLPFLCIMHCIVIYPAPLDTLNLRFIETLKNRYQLPVGFSDHSKGIDAAVFAAGAGAVAIEKHFTLDKTQEGADHKNSLNPDEFTCLVEKIRLFEKTMGSVRKTITPREAAERVYARRGIYSKQALKKGTMLTYDNICFLRPNVSLGAERIDDILGKRLTVDVPKQHPIDLSMIDDFSDGTTNVRF